MKVPYQHITGIVLAGGKSRRMGTDKGLLPFQNSTFIQNTINHLKKVVKNVIIIANHKKYEDFNIRVVEDIIKDSGPLGGLHSGLTCSKTELNVVLANDMPLVTSNFIKGLIEKFNLSYDALWCTAGGKDIPLAGIYKKSVAFNCKKLLQNGEKRLLELQTVAKIQKYEVEDAYTSYLQNINTPEQYRQLNHENYS